MQRLLDIGIDRYGSSRYRYRYRYMFLADIFADTDTDILGQRYRPPIPIPIFSLSRYLANIRSKGRYKPIFWPISGIFNRYLADTDIADIYLADTDTDTDMPIPISSLPIPIYRYRYRPNISANRYIGLSLEGPKTARTLGLVCGIHIQIHKSPSFSM